MCLELESSPGNLPVHILLEEGTNLGAFNIAEKLTALRYVGARVDIVVQERSEGERVWGKYAIDTIQGEVNLEQYLAPIRDPNRSICSSDLGILLGTGFTPGYPRFHVTTGGR